MTIIRVVRATYPQNKAEEVVRAWKQTTGPLVNNAPGCRSEELLRCRDVPNEFVFTSEWESERTIRDFIASEDYRKVRQKHVDLGGMQVHLRLYDRV